jgi:hypothetical protein
MPEDWSPGLSPPEVATRTLLAAVSLLAAEAGVRVPGISWSPDLLFAGEDQAICVETLRGHLRAADMAVVQQHLSEDPPRALRPMLERLLGAGARGRGTAQEAARCRLAGRGLRPKLQAPPSECRAGPASPVAVPPSRVRLEAAVAIYIVLGCDGREPLAEVIDGTLLESLYIRRWIARHANCDTERLIEVVAAAVELARARGRGPVLPELSNDRDANPSSRRDEAPHPAASSSARAVPATRASPARAFRIATSMACIAASRSP